MTIQYMYLVFAKMLDKHDGFLDDVEEQKDDSSPEQSHKYHLYASMDV